MSFITGAKKYVIMLNVWKFCVNEMCVNFVYFLKLVTFNSCHYGSLHVVLHYYRLWCLIVLRRGVLASRLACRMSQHCSNGPPHGPYHR